MNYQLINFFLQNLVMILQFQINVIKTQKVFVILDPDIKFLMD